MRVKSSFDIGIRTAKKGFFDREKIERKMKYAERRAMQKAGRNVRWEARDSLRKRKSSAASGQPPRIHMNGGGLRQIFYYYDWNKGTVVVGPIKYGSQPYSNVTVPELMEKGGDVTVEVTGGMLGRLAHQAEHDRDAKRAYWQLLEHKGETVRLSYDPHPFMKPAMDAVAPDMDKFWRDSIR